MARQAQKRAVKQRLNLKNNQGGKQSGHTIFKRSAQEEPDRIEFYDCDLRPSKLRELKSDDTSDENIVETILETIEEVCKFLLNNDDDFFDRLSRRYSVVFLVVCTAVVSMKQYVGDPISCWMPAQFTGSHVEYANHMCWVSKTYYLPWDEKVPGANDPIKTHISYYQWVPFILIIQAFMFYWPSVVWHSFSKKTGCDIGSLVKSVNSMENLNPEVRKKTLSFMAKHLDKALECQREISESAFAQFIKFVLKKESYLLTYYLFTKLLFIANVFGQLFILNNFLGDNYNLYAFDLLVDLFNTTQVDENTRIVESSRFPRVTMCHFQVRNLEDNVHDYVVQCALPINLLNEKIFILVWFWLIYVAAASIYGFFLWIWYSLPWNRISFLKKYLRLMDRFSREKIDKKMFKTFGEHCLKQDVILVLRLIGKNSNQVVMGEIISVLWDHFKGDQETI